ncbi:MAG: magnesium transporter [Holosporaceae bacterium]
MSTNTAPNHHPALEAEESRLPLWQVVAALLDSESPQDALAYLAEMAAPDVAEVLTQLKRDDRQQLIGLYGDQLDPEVLAELDDTIRDEVLEHLTPRQVADAVVQLESDDALAVIEDLDEEEQQQVLAALPAYERIILQESLNVPEESAGRLMRREVMPMPEHWTIGQARLALQSWDEMPDQFYEIVVVNPSHHPIGILPLAQLLKSKPSKQLREVMEEEFHPIPVLQDQEEVAQTFRRYSLVSAPVVDSDNRLVGTITVDDVVHVLQAEATEDVLRLASAGESIWGAGLINTARPRFIWLTINLATAVLASWVISLFEQTLQMVIALAVLMPIVAGMGGNAGTQTLAVAVRGLATRLLGSGSQGRFVAKELLVALINGIILGGMIGLFSGLWYQNITLGIVMGSAMLVNLVAASLAGTLIPLGLARVKIDPAISSGVFVTTVTDVVGFMSFLGFATLALKWLG